MRRFISVPAPFQHRLSLSVQMSFEGSQLDVGEMHLAITFIAPVGRLHSIVLSIRLHTFQPSERCSQRESLGSRQGNG